MSENTSLHTVAYVTAAVIRTDHELHGTAPYVPDPQVVSQIIYFAEAIDNAWESIHYSLQDANDKAWDDEIVPRLVEMHFTYVDGNYDEGPIVDSIVNIITENWGADTLRIHLKNLMTEYWSKA